MKIKFKKGNLFEGDKIILIESIKEEIFTIHSILLVINQLAINESKRYKKYLEEGKGLLFRNAVVDFIDSGIKGIDLLDDSNEDKLLELCLKHKLKFNSFKQKKLNEFSKDGSP